MIGRDDRGRQGSVESKPYSFYVKQENEKISEKIPICDVHGRRSDGRKVEEIRPVHLRTGESLAFYLFVAHLQIATSKK